MSFSARMENIITILLLIFISVIIIFCIIRQYREYEKFINMDHKTLLRLRGKLDILCDTLEHFSVQNGDKSRIENMCKKIKDTSLRQDETGSYTENKKHIYLCLYDNNNKVYDDNTLMNVLLHECAHVCNETVGHDDAFWEKFEFLKLCAEKAGIYNPSIPMQLNEYCKR